MFFDSTDVIRLLFSRSSECCVVVLAILIFITFSLWSRLMPARWHYARCIVNSDIAFAILAGLLIVLGRIPTWTSRDANVDEAQWLAGSITLADEYGFWRVDGTTSGPLVIHFLWIWNTICGAHTFFAAKLLTTCVSATNCLLSYYAIRTFIDKSAAQALCLPFAVAVALMRSRDFVGYNGEQLPMLLLAVAIVLLLRILKSKRETPGLSVLLGLVLGILPYSKLQAIPMGLCLGLCGLWVLRRKKCIAYLIGGTLIAAGVPLALLFCNGELGDFYVSYIGENMHYAASHSPLPMVKRVYAFPLAWWRIPDGRFLVGCSFVLIAVLGIVRLRSRRVSVVDNDSVLAGAIVYLGTAAYCVIQPGTFYTHYYLFMVSPLVLVVAAFVKSGLVGLSEQAQSRFCQAWAFVALAGVLVGYVEHGGQSYVFEWAAMKSPAASGVIDMIRESAGPKYHLAIWGWMPELHVDSQIPQATSEAHSYRQIMGGEYQEYFVARFVRQLELHEQRLIFVDATDSERAGSLRDARFSHEKYSKVKEFVDQKMAFVGVANGYRVYRSIKNGS